MLQKIPAWLRNKYLLSLLAFFSWIAFFDQNNLLTQLEYRSTLSSIRKDKQFYIEEINNAKKELNELNTNQKALEKFAREKYLMKKDEEEIFVFEAKSN